MRNVAIILTLLIAPWFLLIPAHVPDPLCGRISLLLLFAFTGLGHFVRTKDMADMLPPRVAMRIPIIYLTGIFELFAAVAIVIPPWSRCTGIILIVFLLCVLPSNIYATCKRINFGGHAAGPKYLLVRIPLQFFLIVWIYWFAVRQ